MTSINDRLRRAREDAGFSTVAKAIAAHGWVYSTYAGHENGQRGIKDADKEKYAKAFGVSVSWLQTGSEKKAPRALADRYADEVRGFSEPAVAPYHPQSDTLRRKMIDVARAMSPAAGQVTFYELKLPIPTLMLMAGDVLIVDQKRVEADHGGLVVTRLVNEQTNAAHTVLRVQGDGAILPAYGEAGPGPDDVEAAIGTVICSLRPGVITP